MLVGSRVGASFYNAGQFAKLAGQSGVELMAGARRRSDVSGDGLQGVVSQVGIRAELQAGGVLRDDRRLQPRCRGDRRRPIDISGVKRSFPHHRERSVRLDPAIKTGRIPIMTDSAFLRT